MQKMWQILSGVLSIYLILNNYSDDTQGFYYTFYSLVALQTFVELGLYIVITNVASHEWAKLGLSNEGFIEGDKRALSRLVSLGRFIFKWYGAALVGFLFLVGIGGYWFLQKTSIGSVNWELPWLLHVIFSALLLWCMPFLSLLEGCGQYPSVARFRFWQVFVSTLVLWGVIVSGGGLWAVSAMSASSLLVSVYYLLVSQANFFKPFLSYSSLDTINWRSEIFPMQWRLALQGLTNYFSFYIFTPILFNYYGPAVAGQMGMAQQIVMAMLSISTIWVITNTPRYGILISKKSFSKLDIEWKKDSMISILVMLLGISALLIIQLAMIHANSKYVERLVSPLEMLFLCLGAFFTLGVQCFALYLRAHKREVLTPVGIISGLLMAVLALYFGRNFGSIGISASYLSVMALFTFPAAYFLWKKSKNEWHKM